MSATLPIYVYSGGDIAFQMFNAVAAFCGDNDFANLVFIGAAFSVIGAAIMFIKSSDYKTFFMWFVIYFSISQIIVQPGPTVQIIDETNPLGTYIIDNVPLGISFPAHFATWIETGITNKLESVFHTPNEMDYSQTGMVFGSALFNAAATASLPDNELMQNFDDFYENCIVPDVTVNGKYSWNDLYSSNNIDNFFSSINQSPIWGIYMYSPQDHKREFKYCNEAWPLISQKLKSSTNIVAQNIQHVLSGRNGAQSPTQVMQSLQSTYQTYLNDKSLDAQGILMQNIYVNALKNARSAMASGANASAAMVQAAAVQAEETQEASSFTLGIMATKYLPILQTVLFLFLVGAFPLIVIIMMQPSLFMKVGLNYVIGFIYLGSWPMLFTLLNYCMNLYLGHNLSAAIQYSGVLNINFYNISQIQSANMEGASICGYLMMSIPFLAPILIKGPSVLAAMGQYFGGMAHSVAEQAASGFATGNVSMGNTSFNNQSANKHDSNFSYARGMTTMQTMEGGTITAAPDGHHMYYHQNQDQLPFNVDMKEAASTQLSQGLDNVHQSMYSTGHNYNESVSALSSKMLDLNNTLSNNITSGHGASSSSTAEFRHSLNDAISIAKDAYAKEGVTVSDQQALESALSFGATIGGNIGIGVGRNSVDLSLSGGYQGQSKSSHDTTSTNDFGHNLTSDQRQQLSQDVANIKSYTTTEHSDTSDSNITNAMQGIRSDWNDAKQYAEQYNAQYSQEQSLRESLSKVRSWDNATDYNQTTQFMGWLSEADPHFANVVGSNPTLTRYQQDKLNGMINTYVDQAYMPETPQMPHHSASNIQSSYQNDIAKVNSIGSKSSVQGAYTSDAANTKASFQTDATNSGSLQKDVTTKMESVTSLINKVNHNVQEANNGLNITVDKNIAKQSDISKEGALLGALHRK